MQSVKTFIQDKFIFDKWTALSICIAAICVLQTVFYTYTGVKSGGLLIILCMIMLLLVKGLVNFRIDNAGLVVIYFMIALGVVFRVFEQSQYLLEFVYFISNDTAAKNIADLAKLATIFQMVGDSTAFNADITQYYNILYSNLMAVQNIEPGNKDAYLQMSYQINQFDSAASQMYADIISMKEYLKESNSFIYSMVGGELNSLSISLKNMSLVDNNGLSFMNNWGVLTLLLVMEVVFTLLAFYVLIKDKVSLKK
jgi:hypothetical protein